MGLLCHKSKALTNNAFKQEVPNIASIFLYIFQEGTPGHQVVPL